MRWRRHLNLGASSVRLKELEEVCHKSEYVGVKEGGFGLVDQGLWLDVKGGGREVGVAVGGHFGEVTESLRLCQLVGTEVEIYEEGEGEGEVG